MRPSVARRPHFSPQKRQACAMTFCPFLSVFRPLARSFSARPNTLYARDLLPFSSTSPSLPSSPLPPATLSLTARTRALLLVTASRATETHALLPTKASRTARTRTRPHTQVPKKIPFDSHLFSPTSHTFSLPSQKLYKHRRCVYKHRRCLYKHRRCVYKHRRCL